MHSSGQKEMLQMADMVSSEKGIHRNDVLRILEIAFQKLAYQKYGTAHEIMAYIQRDSGRMVLGRCVQPLSVGLEDQENKASRDDGSQPVMEKKGDTLHANHASHKDQLRTGMQAESAPMPGSVEFELQKPYDPVTLKETLEESLKKGLFQELPSIALTRTTASSVRSMVTYGIRILEREQQYNAFKDRVGQLIYGLVKQIDMGHVIVELERSESLLKRDALIPGETFHPGERIKALIADVRKEPRGSQIFLSRKSPLFMMRLFEEEVPELADGLIQIKAIARDPGSHAKVAVYSADPSLDPVGACVGVRGSRIQAVSRELMGEKIDMVVWSSDIATLVVNAMAPAEVLRIVILDPGFHPSGMTEKELQDSGLFESDSIPQERKPHFRVIVRDDQKRIAIGRGGQNVRLASQLCHCLIDVVSETEELEQHQKNLDVCIPALIESLDIDPVMAHFLISMGIQGPEDILNAPLGVFERAGGFTMELIEELKERAFHFLKNENLSDPQEEETSTDQTSADSSAFPVEQEASDLESHDAFLKTGMDTQREV